MKTLAQMLCLILLSAALSACASNGIKEWREEVLLHDGKKIVVERVQNLGGRPVLESRERAILGETITFSPPGSNQRIVWNMSFRNDVPEANGVNVVLLGVVDNVPYIAGYPAGCIAYNKWKRPNPPQILFKYETGEWRRVALAKFPLQLSQANVIVGGPPADGIKPFYTAEQVAAENHDIDTPEYRTVLREPIANAGGRCGEMVYDGKGGWIGIGWFRNQPTYEACLRYCERKRMDAQYCPCGTLFKGKQ